MGIADSIQKAIDGLTGHKSTHYTRAQVDEMERKKASVTAKPKTGEIVREDPYSSGIGPTGGSTYSTKDFGLQGSEYALPAEGTLSAEDLARIADNAAAEKQAWARGAMRRTANEANLQLRTNSLSDKTRMGGKFTQSGLMKTDADSFKNAQDRMMLKNMMRGIGGSMTPSPGGNF